MIVLTALKMETLFSTKFKTLDSIMNLKVNVLSYHLKATYLKSEKENLLNKIKVLLEINAFYFTT